MSRADKIVMVSVPYMLDNSFFKDFISNNKIEIDSKNYFTHKWLGIPWHPVVNFETMTEYNGFLVEV